MCFILCGRYKYAFHLISIPSRYECLVVSCIKPSLQVMSFLSLNCVLLCSLTLSSSKIKHVYKQHTIYTIKLNSNSTFQRKFQRYHDFETSLSWNLLLLKLISKFIINIIEINKFIPLPPVLSVEMSLFLSNLYKNSKYDHSSEYFRSSHRNWDTKF